MARQLEWELAQCAAQGAVQRATAPGIRINVALLDAGGNPLAFLRMPGAPLHSISISEDRAYTAVSFDMPTSAGEQQLSEHCAAVGLGLPLRARFVPFGGGGVPIRRHGALAGMAAAGLSNEPTGRNSQ